MCPKAHSRHSINFPESQLSRTGEVQDNCLFVPPFNKHLLSSLSVPSIISGPRDTKRRNFLPLPQAGNLDRGQGPPAERNGASRGPRGRATGPFREKVPLGCGGTPGNKAKEARRAPSPEGTEPQAEPSKLTAKPLHGSKTEASFLTSSLRDRPKAPVQPNKSALTREAETQRAETHRAVFLAAQRFSCSTLCPRSSTSTRADPYRTRSGCVQRCTNFPSQEVTRPGGMDTHTCLTL